MLLIYNLLSVIALIIYLPFLISKKGPENRLVFIRERLGLSSYGKTDIWVHAVSMGEMLACLPFLKKLKAEFPEKRITVSTTTYTGQKVAKKRFPEADRIMYMPIDTGLCINKAVNSLRPEIFMTVETELWPVLFHALKGQGSSIVILNGRISKRSYRGYSRIRSLMKRLLDNVDYFYMQGNGDAERIISLGADKQKVGVMGNFKFDFEVNPSAGLQWLDNIKGRILLAASTHKGEDEMVLDAYSSVRLAFPDVRLIIAPRHPERFNEVAELINRKGLKYIRRSEIDQRSADNGPRTTDNDVILLDTIGELSGVFSKVSIAFIGGSLVPVGGHNVLEPAYWSKPVLFGPYMDNFPVADELIKRSAAIMVKDPKDIAENVILLLSDDNKALKMGQNAKAIFNANSGAVKKAVGLIRGFIGTV